MKNIIVISILIILCGCAMTHKRGGDAEIAMAEYQKHLPEAEQCYRSALKADAALAGAVTVEWTVNDKGQVLNPHIKQSEVASAQLEDCLIAHLMKIKFAKTRLMSKATVEYTFHFKKQSTVK